MRKGSTQIGIAVLIFAFLFLVSSAVLEIDDNNTNRNEYSGQEENKTQDYLFYLNDSVLGKQTTVINNYPNLEAGTPKKKEIIYRSSSYKLYSNFLSSNSLTINIPVKEDEKVEQFLVYGNLKRENGNNNMVMSIGNETVYNGEGESGEFPLSVTPVKKGNNPLKIKLEKPPFYAIWDWNDALFKDIKILKIKRNKDMMERNLRFQANKENLDNIFLKLTADCNNYEENSKLKVDVNNFSVSRLVFDCNGRYNNEEVKIPKEIIEKRNALTFKTNGYVKFSFSIEKVYYNNQFKYHFYIDDFRDITDILMYGEFDRDFVDVKINDRYVTLEDESRKSILEYIEHGDNEIEFVNKPLNVEEFYLEKRDWYH